MKHPRITIAAGVIAVGATVGGFTLASGGSSSTPSYGAGASQPATGSTAVAGSGSSATVQTATATVQGTRETILVNAKGLPLYTYKGDTATTSHVTGQLAALWPPLKSAAPTAHGSVGTLTSVATSNGKQVAVTGHFLYTFVEDTPGHVTGQGVQNFFVATPGTAAGASGSATPAGSQSSAGSGYGAGY
jgi:predicted lipoprotein with Yx(FWY)xxD motif